MRNLFLGLLAGLCVATGASAAKNPGNSAAKTGSAVKEIPFSVDTMTYVEGNVLATFYHELGHALIDKMDLPVFAREEDAADSFALVLTEILHTPDKAEQITWASADQYLQLARQAKGSPLDFADTHSPDMVRYYDLICLYYGGDINSRDDFASDNGLPDDRADFCEEQRDMADRAWGGVLKRIVRQKEGPEWLTIDDVDKSDNEYVMAAQQAIREAAQKLNDLYAPKFRLRIDMTDCDEDNAFYEPSSGTIIMCNEYIPPLARSYTPM